MPYRPTKVQFSLFYPSVDAETHDDIVQDVIGPLHELLCEIQFHLVDSSMSGPLCEKFSDFGIDKRFYGNPNYSVLMQAPVVVTDEALGDVGWTSWSVYFYVLQSGQPMVDMATLGNTNERPDDVSNMMGEVEVVNVMTDVMALTLQVSIMEGDFDNKLSLNLPQAHASMPGEEVATWIAHGVFPSNTTIPTHSTESTVAMFMEQSHAIRYTGATMLVFFVSLVYGMDRLARRRRRRQRGADLEEADLAKEQNGVLPWATEDDVGKMLALGRNEIIRSWDKAKRTKTSSSPMVIVPGDVRIQTAIRR